MSEWYNVKREDISIDISRRENKDDVDINFGFSDYSGERYIKVKTKDLIEVLRDNNLIK